MGYSLPNHYIHITFSTKDRKTIIQPPFEKEIHAYITGICNNLECRVLMVGGYTYHIHILCMHSPKITFMALIQKIKANSSKWMKTRDESFKNFSWQKGYGSFSVNPTETEIVIKYIENQHEHHKKKTFQEEYLAFLKKYKVKYDENYLWD